MTARAGFAVALLAAACASSPTGQRVALPGGAAGIGFDDLRYSASLHRVLVPAGRTGTLDLVDPDTLAVTTIAGFGTVAGYSGGHDDGPTSVDEGNGLLYVTDRTTGKLDVVDPTAGRIVASVALAAGPDYVRYVSATNEVWVTEPDADQVEIFTLNQDPTVAPAHAAVVAVNNGPESMVIDNKRGRAYTHRWQATTVAVDVTTRAIVAEWSNGCAASRGIALDEARGFLFASCSEGHLYLAGSACGCLVTLGVSASGALSFIGRASAAGSTHCAVADDSGHAWWCDQDQGSIWRVTDGSSPSL